MRGIRWGAWAVSLGVIGACGGGQGEAQGPDAAVATEMAAGRAAAQSSAAAQDDRAREELARQDARRRAGLEAEAARARPPAAESSPLLDVIPEGTPRLAMVRVAEALRQPLFDELVSELAEMPRVARQTERIEQQCGESPLAVVQELAIFEGQGASEGAPPGAEGSPEQRSPEMLVQLGRSADWALQCLTTMRPEFTPMEVGGRPARRMGSFVVVDAGNDRLLVARQEEALSALQRLADADMAADVKAGTVAEDTAAPDAAHRQGTERFEEVGDSLVFGSGIFPNGLGVESAETVVSAEGEALELNLRGDMRDAEAAATAVRQLQLGLSIAEAFVGRQVESGEMQDGAQEHLRTVLDNVRIQRSEDQVRIALRLPDAETQRFVGGLLARFLGDRAVAGGAQERDPGGTRAPTPQGAPRGGPSGG